MHKLTTQEHERTKRVLISLEQKLLLEAVINFGICGVHASQILGFTSASRLMKKLAHHRKQQNIGRANLPEEERTMLEIEDAQQLQKAALDALMLVSDAIEQGTLDESSLERMNNLITEESLIAILWSKNENHDEEEGVLRKTMAEQIQADSLLLKSLRDLPVPKQAVWQGQANLVRDPLYEENVVNNPIRVTLTEEERRSHLRDDELNEERERLHQYFFQTT